MEDWIRSAEVARILKCDPALISQRLKANKLPKHKEMGGVKFFQRSEIEDYAKKNPVNHYNT